MAKKTENKKGFSTLPKSGDFVLVHWKKPGMFVLFVYVMSCQNTVKKVTFSIDSSYRKLFLGLVNYKAL